MSTRPRAFAVLRRRLSTRRTRFAALAVPALVGAAVACAPQLSSAPAYQGDFPDPSVVRVGPIYYAFGTQAGGGHPAVQRLWSTDHKTWQPTAQPDALAAVPSWADYAGTWGPSVIYINGSYVLYYTVHTRTGNECVSVATANSPAAEFVDNSTGPLICVPNGLSIDPAPFVSPAGKRYLIWKGPDAKGVATIYAQVMAPDGRSLVPGTRYALLKASRTNWTAWNIEGPAMQLSGSTYYLFYSGGNYWTTGYGMGYAACRSPLGPCTDKSPSKPWFGTHGAAKGPGGGSVFSDASGNLFMAYHAWGDKIGYSNGGIRQMWVDPLSFVNGIPQMG